MSKRKLSTIQSPDISTLLHSEEEKSAYKLHRVRALLLGPDLLHTCQRTKQVDKVTIMKRIAELQNQPKYVQRLKAAGIDIQSCFQGSCGLQAFVKLCQLHDKQPADYSNKDTRLLSKCNQDTCWNSIYFHEIGENLQCQVYKLNCANSHDVLLLEYFQRIEHDQYEHFSNYLSLNKYACGNFRYGFDFDYIYYIAYNPVQKQLCGVMQVIELQKHGHIELKHLVSRTSTTESIDQIQYKGVGTMLLNRLVADYQDQPFFGILLEVDPNAIPFYRKFGFQIQFDSVYSDRHYMLYLFENVLTKEKAYKHLLNFIDDYNNTQLTKQVETYIQSKKTNKY